MVTPRSCRVMAGASPGGRGVPGESALPGPVLMARRTFYRARKRSGHRCGTLSDGRKRLGNISEHFPTAGRGWETFPNTFRRRNFVRISWRKEKCSSASRFPPLPPQGAAPQVVLCPARVFHFFSDCSPPERCSRKQCKHGWTPMVTDGRGDSGSRRTFTQQWDWVRAPIPVSHPPQPCPSVFSSTTFRLRRARRGAGWDRQRRSGWRRTR
jgi:hypothetical protein